LYSGYYGVSAQTFEEPRRAVLGLTFLKKLPIRRTLAD
jgi:hypothetical protein